MPETTFSKVLHSLRHQKLSRDIAYTLGSFSVLAVSGLVINIVITGFRDATALGVFNLSYAVYIAASQIAAFGLHYSVLRQAAYCGESRAECGKLLFTAAGCAVLTGGAAAVGVFFAEPLWAIIFDSETTARAIRNAGWGLALFPLNKVLQAYLNGLRKMKAFSMFQGLRYFSVMIFAAFIAMSDFSIETASFGFFIAELITAALAVTYVVSRKLSGPPAFSLYWLKKHFTFGGKGLLGGMFAEFNSRVDVLMIGIFLAEHEVGVYSFAAMLVDGLYHVLAMVRINFNPMLVVSIRDRQAAESVALRRHSKKYILPAISALSIMLAAAFYILTAWVMPGKGLLAGLPSLIILLAALVAVAVFVPFDNLLLVSGYPGYQTLQQIMTVAANVLVAAALLPCFGIEGAAAGTACGYLAGIATLIFFARRLLGWRLISNDFKIIKGPL